MSELERYIKENINQYHITAIGYPNLENYDPQDELNILAVEDDHFLSEVFTHHIDDYNALQVDLTKAVMGDIEATTRALGMIKRAMKSYFDYIMDDLAHDEQLLKWQDEYAEEYAKSAAIEAQIDEMLMEDL